MAITTYSQLRSAIGSWLHRGDLQAISADLIMLAEVRLNRNLRVRQMEKHWSQSVGAQSVTLPNDWLEFVDEPQLDGQPLRFVSREEYKRRQKLQDYGRYYTIQGTRLYLGEPVGAPVALEADYYARIPALSDSTTTNWLLRDAPDVYLYGALLEAAPYLNNDPRIDTWRALLQVAINDLQVSNDRAKYSGGTLAIGLPR